MDQRGRIGDPHVSGLVDMGYALVEIGEFDGRIRNRDHAIAMFNKRIADVQAAFPSSRLLTFDVSEGCEVPAISFPRLNSSKQFTEQEWKDEIAPAI
jgi:hypothetical protein